MGRGRGRRGRGRRALFPTPRANEPTRQPRRCGEACLEIYNDKARQLTSQAANSAPQVPRRHPVINKKNNLLSLELRTTNMVSPPYDAVMMRLRCGYDAVMMRLDFGKNLSDTECRIQ
jgi:hypothetical protein